MGGSEAATVHAPSSEALSERDNTGTLQLAASEHQARTLGPHNRSVRIPRHYDGLETCQFSTVLPSELDGEVDAVAFARVMHELNKTLKDAHNTTNGLLDHLLASLTFQLSPGLLGTHYTKCMKRFDAQLRAAETDLFAPAGYRLVPPSLTAFMFIEVRAL